MPHALASAESVASVATFESAIRELVRAAKQLKPDGGIEPPVKYQDLRDQLDSMKAPVVNDGISSADGEGSLVMETAIRQVFYDLQATSSINEPGFGSIWSLIDIITLLSDRGLCEPHLATYMVEELLESQTIDGCRVVFDYLESRGATLVAKSYKKKYLTILRACNDLLKRLSRAEDSVFCGRVFIYLFSTLTFGDRSSVNLRGEFHVANTTIFDDILTKQTEETMDMDIDNVQSQEKDSKNNTTITITEPVPDPGNKEQSLDKSTESNEKNTNAGDEVLDYDTLYPMFWSLQGYFCKPTTLFEAQHLATFKRGLEATLKKFKQVQKETDAGSTNAQGDEAKQVLKRKWQADEDTNKTAFNPKYLTSRDLFELEISDLAFRRHVLVQGLVLIDFLLSQTAQAKLKLESLKNRAVIYTFTLDEEQTQWAEGMRTSIAAYLQQGTEGKFYYRMVDTVLSRDKNWVYWKAESCPMISRAPISFEDYVVARTGAKRATAVKRPKMNPLGALDLKFLSQSGDVDVLEKFKDPDRFSLPAIDAYRNQIANDTLDLEMATEDEKERLQEMRASKTWRTLRIASRSKFSKFDKIEDGNKLDILFASKEDEKDLEAANAEETEKAMNAEEEKLTPLPEPSESVEAQKDTEEPNGGGEASDTGEQQPENVQPVDTKADAQDTMDVDPTHNEDEAVTIEQPESSEKDS